MRIIIVDDEQLSMDYLEHQLQGIDGIDIQIVGKYTNPLLGKRTILNERVDVVFLDIQLPEVNGIELAGQLLEGKPGIQIVFVTGYNKYAVQAFELNAIDYVMKPVTKQRLKNTMERLEVKHLTAQRDKDTVVNGELTLQLFREVLIYSPDETFSPLKWRTLKAQELFLYLIQHRGEHVLKDTLIELLWPEYETRKAYSQLYTTIYHIRKTLEPYRNHFSISNISEGYIMNLKDVRVDVDIWEKEIQNVTQLSKENVESFAEIMSLYKGDYLHNLDYWWSESERERLKIIWTRNAFRLGEAYEENLQPEKAIAVYLEICERSPLTEEAYFSLMQLFADNNQHSSVHQQYQLLESVLREEMNAEPIMYIRKWYQNWVKQYQR